MKLNRLVPVMFAVAFGLAACGGGAGSTSQTPTSTPPSGVTAAIELTNGVTQDPKTGNLEGVVGNEITLDGTRSTSTGGSIKSYRWSVDSRPAGSKANPASPGSATTDFTPDVAGNYSLTLQATDGKGRTGAIQMPIVVTRHPVTLSVNIGVIFTPSPTALTQNIQVGSYITLDASHSTVATGKGPLTFTWTLKSKPAGSATNLSSTSNPVVDLTADVVGTYDVVVKAVDKLGDQSSAEYIFIANPGPSAVVIAGIASAGSLSGTLQAATGYLVMLNGASSVVQPGDSVSYIWSLVKKPTGSTVSLANLSGSNTNFIPDVVGQYIVTLDFEDTTQGLASTYTMTIDATQGPVAIVSASGSPVAAATVPAFVSTAGATVKLLGDGSYELGGDPLTYAWSLTSKPSGSAATIANSTSVDASITPDLNGTYGIKLTVTDTTSGAQAVSTATLQVGAYLPVAVINQPQVSVILGGSVTDTALLSYDPQGLPLTFDWEIDAAPAGSTATISGSNTTPGVSFTPDVAGTYTLTVSVSNGILSSDGVLTITAFAPTSGTVPLFYQPLMEKYSTATDKLVLVSANPNTLHIVDLSTGNDTAVGLPSSVVAMSLSPDGTKAAVLHSAVVDVVDLNAGTLLHSWPTSGAQTMVLISNSGLIYVAGQSSGCCNESMQVLNASTGATVQNFTSYPALYQAAGGVLADSSNQIFVSSGAVDVYSISLNPANGQLVSSGAQTSITYSLQCGPLWLSSDESLLFACNGDYFSTNGLGYAGTLGLGSHMLSVSDDTNISEAVVLTEVENSNFTYVYPGVYNLFTGSTLFPQGTIPLPLVAGVQGYGIAMFHSSSDQHVMVLQTGSNQPGAAGVQYFAILR